jgi:hypothetical protein
LVWFMITLYYVGDMAHFFILIFDVVLGNVALIFIEL